MRNLEDTAPIVQRNGAPQSGRPMGKTPPHQHLIDQDQEMIEIIRQSMLRNEATTPEIALYHGMLASMTRVNASLEQMRKALSPRWWRATATLGANVAAGNPSPGNPGAMGQVIRDLPSIVTWIEALVPDAALIGRIVVLDDNGQVRAWDGAIPTQNTTGAQTNVIPNFPAQGIFCARNLTVALQAATDFPNGVTLFLQGVNP